MAKTRMPARAGADETWAAAVAPSHQQDWSAVDLSVNAVPPEAVVTQNPFTASRPERTVSVFKHAAGLDPTRDYPDYPASITPRENPQAMDPVTGLVHTPLDTPPFSRVLGTGSVRGLAFRASNGEVASPIEKVWVRWLSTAFPWVFSSPAGGMSAIWPRYGYSVNNYTPTTRWAARARFHNIEPVPAVNRNVQKSAVRSVLYGRVGTNPTGGITAKGRATGFLRGVRGAVTEWPLPVQSYPIIGQTRDLT